jgi:hypothetical protein
MTHIEVALVLAFLAFVALVGLRAVWVTTRVLTDIKPAGGVDPILGTRDRVAVYCPSGLLIQPHPSVLVPLPDHLTTQEEIFAWMTKEMPKVVERAVRQ